MPLGTHMAIQYRRPGNENTSEDDNNHGLPNREANGNHGGADLEVTKTHHPDRPPAQVR